MYVGFAWACAFYEIAYVRTDREPRATRCLILAYYSRDRARDVLALLSDLGDLDAWEMLITGDVVECTA